MSTTLWPRSSRQIAFVERRTVNFNTTDLVKNAVVLGDIDNDIYGDIELAVGNSNGELGIFRGKNRKPWRKASGLGAIACMAVGDVRNHGANSLVVISSEGHCSIFDLQPPPDLQPDSGGIGTPGILSRSSSIDLLNKRRSVELDGSLSNKDDISAIGRPGSTSTTPIGGPSVLDSKEPQSSSAGVSRLTAPSPGGVMSPSILDNPSVLHTDQATADAMASKLKIKDKVPTTISSFYSSIRTEKLAGLASAPVSTAPSTSPSPTETDSTPKRTWKRVTDVVEPSLKCFIEPNANCCMIVDVDGDGKKELVIGSNNRAIITYTFGEIVQADGSPSVISLVLKNKFPLIGQVTSLCTTQGDWGSTVLLAGLQNGSYVTLDSRGELAYRVFGSPNVASAKHMNRTDITGPTEIRVAQRLGSGTTPPSTLYALASLDGNLKLQDADSKIMWNVRLDHQLFELSAIDITGDGNEEIVVSSWDGMTIIMDHVGNMVKFRFEDRVRAFRAGTYSVAPNKKRPCFIFVTFSDDIFIYDKITLRSIASQNIIRMIAPELERLNDLKLHDEDEWDGEYEKELMKAVLYDNLFDEERFTAKRNELRAELEALKHYN